MEMKTLLQFIDSQDKKLIKYFGGSADQEKRILARTVKLAEELGELCNEVLAFNGDQRKDKLDKHSLDNLAEEFADVLITTLLLAKSMDVDIPTALKNKIEKINKRFENI